MQWSTRLISRHRRPAIWLLVIVVVLVALRLALPYVVKDYLNRRMERMGDYHGQLVDVSIHLWRGAYSIEELRVDKVSGKLPVPLFSAWHTDISLSWRALGHGRLRGKVTFEHAALNFVDGNGKASGQSGKGVNWRAQLQMLMPMQLDELTVRDSAVTFHNFVSNPPVDLKMTDVNGTVLNLSNADRRQGRRVAMLKATAKVLQDAPLETSASFDPLERRGDFRIDLKVTGIHLTRLNDLARAYAKLDFAGGSGDFVLQLEAKDGQLDGYAKPLLHDIRIFSWKQDVEQEKKNPLRVAWEAVAQGVTTLFKNQQHDQFATRVPISGRIDDKHLSTWDAIIGVLHNAFVKAYTPQLEHLEPAPQKK
jgi:uncharacterized protein YhdP